MICHNLIQKPPQFKLRSFSLSKKSIRKRWAFSHKCGIIKKRKLWGQKNDKIVTKHICWEYLKKVEDYRHTYGIRELYDRRKETI